MFHVKHLQMETLSHCPVCENDSFTEFLKSKDFFLTGKEFIIVQCKRCGFKFTNPRPGKDEISAYYESEDYLSHHTEKNDPETRVYKWIRKINIRSKYKIIHRYSSGKKLLDIGCGTGEFLAYCRQKGMEITGIEPGKKAQEYASGKLQLPVYDESWLNDQKYPGFDIITLWHVLEHVHGLIERMKIIKDLLNPGGLVCIALPNPGSWDARHYKEYWAAYDLPRHLYHFDRPSIMKLAEKNELKVIKIIPIKWDAYYISLLSGKYMSRKSGFLKAIINGYRSNLSGRGDNMNYSSLIYILK